MITVLVTLDGSATSEAILPVLGKLGKGLEATLHLLTVVAPPEGTRRPSRLTRRFVGSSGAEWVDVTDTSANLQPIDRGWLETEGQAIDRVMSEGRDLLAGYAEPLRRAGFDVAFDIEVSDDPAEAIIRSAREHAADFVAMATHGRSGVSQVVQGSVASTVVRSGVAPVILVRPDA